MKRSMKMIRIVLQIPDEFEPIFYNDYFKAVFERVTYDIEKSASECKHYGLAGSTEIKILLMLRRAFANYDSYDTLSRSEYLKGYNAGFKRCQSLTSYVLNDKTAVKLALNSMYGKQKENTMVKIARTKIGKMSYEVKDFTDNEKFIETWNNSTDIIDILKLITLHNVKFETYVNEKFISLDDDYRKLWHIEKEI